MIRKMSKELKILTGSFLALTIVALGIFAYSKKSSSDLVAVEANQVNESLVRSFNHKTGPDNAKVKIVEFYDPECEACSAFFPFIKDIVAKYKDDIQLTVRYALYHGNSTLAAKATEAAALQNKFWEYQEILFTKQDEWSHKHGPATEYFVKYATELGLDLAKFQIDLNDQKTMENIAIDIGDGQKLGVNGTPTLFINGQKLEDLNPAAFKEMVETELRK